MSRPDEPLGRLRDDLVFEATRKGAALAWRVVDPATGIEHVLHEIEHVVARAFDGRRSAADVVAHCAAAGVVVQADHVESFHRELEGMSFVLRDAEPSLPEPPPPDHRADAAFFVDEAKEALRRGRTDVAKGLVEAALAIDPETASKTIDLVALKAEMVARTTEMDVARLAEEARAAQIAATGRDPSAPTPAAPRPIAASVPTPTTDTVRVPRARAQKPGPTWIGPALLVAALAVGVDAASKLHAQASEEQGPVVIARPPVVAPRVAPPPVVEAEVVDARVDARPRRVLAPRGVVVDVVPASTTRVLEARAKASWRCRLDDGAPCELVSIRFVEDGALIEARTPDGADVDPRRVLVEHAP